VHSRVRYTLVKASNFALKSHMERSRAESLVFVVASSLIALSTLFAVTWVAGFDHVAARLHAIDPVWFATAFGAQIVAYIGYVLAYREVARVEHDCELGTRSVVAAVTAGFGAFVAPGVAGAVAQTVCVPSTCRVRRDGPVRDRRQRSTGGGRMSS
jgi:hypothetical protein